MWLMGKKPYKIAVSRQLGGIGDMIMCTPVFRGLKEKHGRDCHITVMTTWDYASGALPELLKQNPYIDDVVRIEPYEYAPPMLRANKREYTNVPNNRTPPCVQRADEFIELNVICSIVETKEQAEPENVRSHRTDIWCDHARVNPSSRRPILNLTPQELGEGKRWLDHNTPRDKPRIGVVLKAMSAVREWPHIEHFAVDLLEAGMTPVTIDPMRRVDDRIPAVIGKRIRQVAAICAHLDAVVSPDTGLLHVAGAVGAPVLGIFGSTDGALRMREYAGRYTVTKEFVTCGPCWYRVPCLRNDDARDDLLCMKLVTRKVVLTELQSMLEEVSTSRSSDR
jgi:ADP-heptose:LPS heptosyltransferase